MQRLTLKKVVKTSRLVIHLNPAYAPPSPPTSLNDVLSLSLNKETIRLIQRLQRGADSVHGTPAEQGPGANYLVVLVELIAAKVITVPTEDVWPLCLIQRISDKWARDEVYRGTYNCPAPLVEWNDNWKSKRITRDAMVEMLEAFSA